jgi:hypothetical protein
VQLPFFGDYRDYLLLGGASTVIILISLFINGVYPQQKFGIRRSLTGAFWGSVITSLFVFFSKQFAVSRPVIVLSAVFQIVFITGWRFILKFISRNILGGVSLRISRELLPTRSIIIGSDAVSREIYLRFMKHHEYSGQLVGIVSTGTSSQEDKKPDIPALGDLQEIRTIIKKHNITDIIFAAASHSYERIIGTITLCQDERVNFKLVPSSLGLIIGKSSVVPLGDVPLVDIEYKFFESKNRFLKRLLDISLAGFLVIAVLPAYLEEKWRKGLKNRSIYILSENGAPLYIKQVEKGGRKYRGWARLYPLWIHVLKGEISFIGSPLFTEKRTSIRRISLLKPGIFSFESAEKGKAAELNRRTFELTYLKNYTILYDLRILTQRILRRE